MPNSEITIFFSWQSDLSASETRNVIQDSIKDAVKMLRDTIDIEADRDTKGQYGSPDISQTILAKIDNCDIFIADVTPVCTYEKTDKDGKTKIKLMPNPNVMLELGYASHVVGWDNVICIMNKDYGKIEDMPFDIRNRRLTSYSLKSGKSKGEVKRLIKSIIQDTVEKIIEEGKRPKAGFSNIKVGFFENGIIDSSVSLFRINKTEDFNQYKINKIKKAKKLFDEISQIVILQPSADLAKGNSDVSNEAKIQSILQSKKSIVTISEDTKNTLEENCIKYLNMSINDNSDFYNIGNLKESSTFYGASEYEGTDDEKNKYEKIMQLDYELNILSYFEEYVKTFDEMYFIRLAVENDSTVYDEDIAINIKIDTEKASIIIPSKTLINPLFRHFEGIIIDEGYIKDLFYMNDSDEISYDVNYLNSISFEGLHHIYNTKVLNGTPKQPVLRCELSRPSGQRKRL